MPFDAATTPLQEGVTPTSQRIQYEDVSATLRQYGAVSEITDFVQDVAEDPVLNNLMELAGEQAALTLEKVTFNVVKAGTSVYYANGSSRGAVNSAISLNKQRQVTRGLMAQKAMRLTNVLSGSVNYGTSPIEASYVAVAHTDVDADIRNLAGFVPTAEYGSRNTMSEYEAGSVENVRYMMTAEMSPWEDAGAATSTMVSTTGSNADVYPILYFGKEAFGCVPLKGKESVTPIVINPNNPSSADPLGQRGYVGWKTYYTCVILNESWMARLECSVTDLA